MTCFNRSVTAAVVLFAVSLPTSGAGVTIRVEAGTADRPVSRYLTGACIEDVNHEIYGGLYSQMIFGESFQEPPRSEPVRGFVALDGLWSVKDGELIGGDGPGPKLLSTAPPMTSGEAGVDVYFPGGGAGNAGLIVQVDKAGAGADNFDGYEVSIDVMRKLVTLSRHHHNWKPLKEVPCDLTADRWIALSAKITGRIIAVNVNGKTLIQFEDTEPPLRAGGIGLRDWQRGARYRHLWRDPGTGRVDLPFEASAGEPSLLSGMWRPVRRGTAQLKLSLETNHPFVGMQSQRIEFTGGEGESGIENQGLNRQGMAFVAGKPYDGHVWVRSDKPTEVCVALESGDGLRQHAKSRLPVSGDEWHRIDFTLTPDATDAAGRLAICLTSPGSVVIGHAFLQPGEWGRFKGLPLRRDVVEGLIDQGITVLRYGGSMVNAPEYRWKKMIGPRDRRPPYKGTWYPYSSNGFGIIEFAGLCEAAGFLGVPDFNMDETPGDMADFVEYANGSVDTEWGRKRAADGHHKPFHLTHLELGNEERVDDKYFEKFAPMARAIWAKDPSITLVVGDFAYNRTIQDPMDLGGADSHITTLAAHRRILDLAREQNREVWFDVHVWTDGPAASPSLKALPSYIDALEKLSAGAKHRVVVFELNAKNATHRRALANAWAIGAITLDGRVPIVASANGLQPDGQNDNGWDQGLLFLNPTGVWLQPPGYVLQMISRNYQPRAGHVEIDGSTGKLSAIATHSEDGRTIVLQVVNLDEQPTSGEIHLSNYSPTKPVASVEELAGPLDARNTVPNPLRITPRLVEWQHGMKDGTATLLFPAHSFTIIRFE